MADDSLSDDPALAQALLKACDSGFIERVNCASIPWPAGKYPDQIFIVNCLCQEWVGTMEPKELLRVTRLNLVSLLRVLAETKHLWYGVDLRFSSAGIKLNPDGELPRKYYIYGILSEGLDVPSESIDSLYLVTNQYFRHGSDSIAIRSILEPSPLDLNNKEKQ